MFKDIGINDLESDGVWYAVKDHFTGKVTALVSSLESAKKIRDERDAIHCADITRGFLSGFRIEMSEGKMS